MSHTGDIHSACPTSRTLRTAQEGGRHSFSLGAWIQRVQDNQSGPAQNKSGTVAYSSLLTFLQDSPTSFNANLVVTPLGWRQWKALSTLFKKISINEQWDLQFRAEAFNVFNHANFAIPNAVVFQGTNYSSSAGIITGTATTSRQIQFALKLLW